MFASFLTKTGEDGVGGGGGMHIRVMEAAKIFIRLIAIEVSGHHVFGDSQVIWAHFPFFCGQEDNNGNQVKQKRVPDRKIWSYGQQLHKCYICH